MCNTGCGHTGVLHGAWIGAVSGAALGTGAGVLISDDKLLGSTKESKMQLESGSSIATGALIGTVFGAVIGSMIGHQQEDRLKAHAQVDSQATAF